MHKYNHITLTFRRVDFCKTFWMLQQLGQDNCTDCTVPSEMKQSKCTQSYCMCISYKAVLE